MFEIKNLPLPPTVASSILADNQQPVADKLILQIRWPNWQDFEGETMSLELMQTLPRLFSQQLFEKLADVMGADSTQATAATELASAALLAGVLRKASSLEGAKSIFELAGKADLAALEKLEQQVGSHGWQSSGEELLKMILGGNQAVMVESLGKHLALQADQVKRLLAGLAPTVIALIGQQIKTQKLELAGFGEMLRSQKQSLSTLLPSNLMRDLGLENVLRENSGSNFAGSSSIGSALDSADGHSGNEAAKTLISLVLFMGIGFLLWQFLAPEGQPLPEEEQRANRVPAQESAESTQLSDPRLRDAFASLKNAVSRYEGDFSTLGKTGSELKTGFEDVTAGLSQLADSAATEDTAKKVIERINGFAARLDGLQLDHLEGMAKNASSRLADVFLKSIDGLIEEVPQPWRTMVEPAIRNLAKKLESVK